MAKMCLSVKGESAQQFLNMCKLFLGDFFIQAYPNGDVYGVQC